MQEEEKKETVENYQNTRESSPVIGTITSIIWGIITLIAIYYSFVIYKGFNLGGFLLALLFSPIYLLWGFYKVGFPPKMKFNKKK